MAGRRTRWVTLGAVAAGAAMPLLMEAVTSMAENAATGQDHWPGPLDWVRQHGWPVLLAGVVVAVLLTVVGEIRERRPGPGAGDPRPPAPPVVPDWVVDRAQVREIADAVTRPRASSAVGITAAAGLTGAGGFGKTTVADLVWADRAVRKHFKGRIYRIVLGRDVRAPAALAAKVSEATRFITRDTDAFEDPRLAGEHLGRLLDDRPPMLLILDDVWTAEQLAPFLCGGDDCVRLVTTRVPELLPRDAVKVEVDRMSPEQAERLLTRGFEGHIPDDTLRGLLDATGRWPLLLRLANRIIERRTRSGLSHAAAAAALLEKLRQNGPTAVDDPAAALDLGDAQQRNNAVKASIEATTDLLPPGAYDRFTELGIFAEDEKIPISLIVGLWESTGGLDENESRDLCVQLASQSLLHVNEGRVQLHDVIRDFLRRRLGDDRLRDVNALLVDSASRAIPPADPQPGGGTGPDLAWWRMADDYLADQLIPHLLAADRQDEALALALDLRWIEWRLQQRTPTGPITDLTHIPHPDAERAAGDLTRAAHLLEPTEPTHAQAAILRSRLHDLPVWNAQAAAWRTPHPVLRNDWPLPDLPDPALIRTLTEHSYTVTALAIAPDGTWFVTSAGRGAVYVWDRETCRVTDTLSGHTSTVNGVAISPDGRWIVTASADKTARVWDRETGRTTLVFTGHSDRVEAVAIAPDGTWVATASHDKTVQLWDRATGRTTGVLSGHTNRVDAVAISPDGTWLVTGGMDRTARVWDRATCRSTAILTDHRGPVRSVAISPDGTWFVTGGMDRTARVWDRDSGEVTGTLTGHTLAVTWVAISSDGTWLATASIDHTTRVWDKATGRTTATFTGHADYVHAVAISPDDTWLATASSDATIRLWDRANGRTRAGLSDDSARVQAVAFSPDGTWLAAAGWEGIVRERDRVTGRITATFTGNNPILNAVAVSPDGGWLASGGYSNTVLLWDRSTGDIIATLSGHTDSVTGVVISPDGTWLASSSDDCTVRLWDRATHLVTTTLEHRERVQAVAVSPDGTWLATVDWKAKVLIWDRATGRVIGTLPGRRRTYDVAISPDGSRIATASGDHVVQIWSKATGRLLATLTGLAENTSSMAFSPDGTLLATTGFSTSVRVWDLRTATTLTMTRTEGRLTSCVWSPDGRALAVGGTHGLYMYSFTPGGGT